MHVQAVFDHYNDVTTWEHAQVTDDSDIVQPGAQLPHISGIVQDAERFQQIASLPELPRQSHALIKRAFDALVRVSDVKWPSADVVGEYTGRYAMPLANVRYGLVAYTARAERRDIDNDFEACPKAEPGFVAALQQTRRAHADGAALGHGKVSVYHDASGQPIAFRKERDESSALLLHSVELNGGAIAPAGTIVGLAKPTSDVKNQTGSYDPYKNGKYSYASFAIQPDFAFEPLRLSPWVYQQEVDRALYAVEPRGRDLIYDTTRGKLVTETTIDDFREAAQQVMELCA